MRSLILLSLNHTIQSIDGDCLVACAEMVLTYIGRSISHKRLRRLLDTHVGFGTPHSNIQNLDRINLTVHYAQGTIETLYSYLEEGHPCIVFVHTRELPDWTTRTQHALVVVGMDETDVWVHDPDQQDAPISIPLGDFDLAWFEMGEMFAVITR